MECTCIESWDDRTSSVVVIWTGRNWRNTGGVMKHARGEKRREESSLFLFPSRVSSVSRYVLSRAACSYISAFSERRAYSRCTEDRRCQSWATGVETLDFTIGICSTLTFLYFDLYLNTAYAANVYLQLCLFYNCSVNRKRTKYYSIN